MKHLSTYLAAIGCVASLMIGASCSSSRQSTQPVVADAQSITPATVATTIAPSKAKQWTSVYAPVKVNITAPSRIGASGRLTMKRGEYIHLSMRFLGMEVAALYITPDSCMAIDKYHKYYFAESIKNVIGDRALTLENIQAVLLGQAVYPGRETLSGHLADYYNIERSEASTTMMLTPRKSMGDIDWTYTVALQPQVTLSGLTVKVHNTDRVQVTYKDPVSTAYGPLMQSSAINANINADTRLSATMTVDIDDAQWDTDRNVSWRMPGNYRRITIANLRDMLSF